MYKVIFQGFESKAQAEAFADWYSGSGEQESGEWMEQTSDCSGALVTKITPGDETDTTVVVDVRIYHG